MPTIREHYGRYQLRVKHRLLPGPYYATFDDYDEAEQYGKQLVDLLKRGIVPQQLIEAAPTSTASDPLLPKLVVEYGQLGPVTPMDSELMSATMADVLGLRVSKVTAEWVDGWIKKLKMESNNSPGTIRKKVGLYGRILDWHIRRTTPHGQQRRVNPFRGLPRGYSTYTRDETAELARKHAKAVAKGGTGTVKPKLAKRDKTRDRRLLPDEAMRVYLELRGQPIPGAKYLTRAKPDLEMLFEVIVQTGMRLREAYSMRASHLQLARGFTHVEGSKGRDGIIKPRIVPLKPELAAKLKAYAEGKGKDDLLFPYWDGTQADKKLATRGLVQSFRRVFQHAMVHQFTEHDLRHEACCRWFELRDKEGRWLFSDVEICRIMGWSNYAMVLRYASLRGEDLAMRMGHIGPALDV